MFENEKIFTAVDALASLVPGAMWVMMDNDINQLEWKDDSIEQPTLEAIEDEVQRLQSQYDSTNYQRLRAAEYPSINDYIDGIVKGDQTQVENYIAECLAVKEKYPKPSV